MLRPVLRSFVFALLVLAGAVHGQTASLVRDISVSGTGTGSSPWELLAVPPGKVFFFGPGLDSGGLWVSDGTSAGTSFLQDLCLGDAFCSLSNRFLGSVGSTVLWISESPGEGNQLWRSDGTRPGTYPLTGPGTGIAYPQINPDLFERTFVFFRNAFYFIGCDGTDGCTSYRTDGSLAGTLETGSLGTEPTPVGNRLFFLTYDDGHFELRVTEDVSASAGLGEFDGPKPPSMFTAAGSNLFFVVDTGGQDLWVSNGTEAGTRAVTDLPNGTSIQWLKPIGNRLYFSADDVVHGKEIWVSDGTPAGTRRVTEFGFNEPFPFGFGSDSVAELNGRLIFAATDGIHPPWLWTTAGTPESTASLPLPEGCISCSFAEDLSLIPAGGRLLFVAKDNEHGTELWHTDGTAAGTGLVKDLCPGGCSSLSFVDQAQPWPGGALLIANDGSHGPEIWRSDGTSQGTRRITELKGFFSPEPFAQLSAVALGNQIVFSATDDSGGGLWITDGAPASTRVVARLGLKEAASEPRDLTVFGERLLFTACDGQQRVLWSALSGAAESLGVAVSCFEDESWQLTPAGGLVFFKRIEFPHPPEIWRTDGTAAGTFRVAANESLSSYGTDSVTAFQGRFYFQVWNQIWVSDGTIAGTALFYEHENTNRPLLSLQAAGDAFYFMANNLDDSAVEYWRSDGSAAGTIKLLDMPRNIGGAPQFTVFGSRVYFQGIDRKLWKTDGTPGGTMPVGSESSQYGAGLSDLTVHGGALYYFANTDGGRGLFRSDGTAAGTIRLKVFRDHSPYFESPTDLTAFAGKLFFSADDGEHGIELWRSDGTSSGTVLVRDILPDRPSSSSRSFAVGGGRLFFTAYDGVHGTELWVCDGTAAGTRLVQDLNPYANASRPEQLTVAGNRLYFTADDGISGRELWSFPLAAGPGCQPSQTRLCLNGGRFQVEASWKDFQGNRGVGQAVALTADTGYFWFFDPANVEAVLKVLDGRGLNNHFWVFYGALSSVEYNLTVTDTQTGAARRYFNPSGQLASVGDTKGFGPLGAFSRTAPNLEPLTLVDSRFDPAAATGSCQPSSGRLCLNGDRFAVEAAWKDFQGKTGTGNAVELTADTGWFWFFDPANVEVMIKVLDGTPLNGKHWVFYGALSNVEYTLTVTDTATGKKNTYKNPIGRFASVADTGAF